MKRRGNRSLHIVYNRSMTAEETMTVRVPRSDIERLQALARDHQTTVTDVLLSAIDALERQEWHVLA